MSADRETPNMLLTLLTLLNYSSLQGFHLFENATVSVSAFVFL